MSYRSKYTGWEIDEAIGRILNGEAVGPKGTYSPTAQYKRLDIVQYEGASYLVLRPVQGVTPEDGEDYMLLAAKGEIGATGATGEGGGAGPAGPGVPPGGTTGQVLAKKSEDDYDGKWVDPPQGGGFVEMETSIPVVSRTADTLYGLIL